MTNPIYDLYYDNFDKFMKDSADNWNNEYKIFDDPVARVVIGLFKREIPSNINNWNNTFINRLLNK